MNTIVIPIVRQDYVLDCIESIRATAPDDFKIIVVDQTHRSNVTPYIHDAADLAIVCKWNYGFAQAMNLGVRLATTEYVTCANDDTVSLPGWWKGVLRTFKEVPEAIAVNPSSPNPPHWEDKEPICTLEQAKNGYLFHNGPIVDGIMMWFTVFKRQEWFDLGMFDERFSPGSGEDYDALARIYQAGFRAVSSPHSWVWHYWSKSKDTLSGSLDALPQKRSQWNKLSTKGFGDQGLWHPDVNQWGRDCERTDSEVKRMPI